MMAAPGQDTPDVTVITVAYSSMDVLPAMAASLPKGVPLVVVNNGPDDGVVAWARAQGHRLIEPGRNLGFGAACNLGTEAARSDFLFFLNPDARLTPGALPALQAFLQQHQPGAPLVAHHGGDGFHRIHVERPARKLFAVLYEILADLVAHLAENDRDG